MIPLALLLQVVSTPAPPPARAIGAYELLACTAECTLADTALQVARGIVVLDTTTVDQWSLRHTSYVCFDLKVRKGYDSYLALSRRGGGTWQMDKSGDTLRFFTYRSPDAYHTITAVLTDSGFVGRGNSSGAGAAEIHVPDEYIIARKLGAADAVSCKALGVPLRSGSFSLGSFGLLLGIGAAMAMLVGNTP